MRDMQDEAGAPLTAADASTPTHDTTPGTATGTTADDGAGAPRDRRTLFLLLATVAVVAYVGDQVTKVLALDRLTPGEPVDVVGEFIRLNLIRNAGAAFSIADGATWVLTLIAFGVLVFIIRTARRIGSRGWAWALGMLLGGSLGNLTDRMLREPAPGRGHVVDFIDYFGLFIGNVADIAIVSAAVLIGLLALRGVGVDGKRAAHHGRHEGGASTSGGGTRG
jgi:signal peptidase II